MSLEDICMKQLINISVDNIKNNSNIKLKQELIDEFIKKSTIKDKKIIGQVIKDLTGLYDFKDEFSNLLNQKINDINFDKYLIKNKIKINYISKLINSDICDNIIQIIEKNNSKEIKINNASKIIGDVIFDPFFLKTSQIYLYSNPIFLGTQIYDSNNKDEIYDLNMITYYICLNDIKNNDNIIYKKGTLFFEKVENFNNNKNIILEFKYGITKLSFINYNNKRYFLKKSNISKKFPLCFYKFYSNIFFYGSKEDSRKTNSNCLRITQVFNTIIKYTTDYDFQISMNYSNVKNSYVFICKQKYGVNENFLKLLKENNNKIIYDILDDYCSETKTITDYKKNNFIKYIDIFLVNNPFMKKFIEEKYKIKTYLAPHAYDLRIDNYNLDKVDTCCFLFNGEANNTNCLHIDKLQKEFNIDNNIGTKDFNIFLKKYSNPSRCHISIRKAGTFEYLFKPCTKLITAAACDSNIITTYDESIKMYIDESYPYLLKDSSWESVKKMFNYVIETHNTEIWNNGLNIIKDIKKKLTIDYIVKNYYITMLDELS